MHQVREAMGRMGAKDISAEAQAEFAFELQHRLLEDVTLQINLLCDIDGVNLHLRQNPLDLLIYDERGEDATEATRAIEQIRSDVRALAELWGPDFLFPMSRVVAILKQEPRQAERAFELGQLDVRDVCIAPRSIATVLLWLKRVLTHGIVRNQNLGFTLAGGGLEGFLYQIGCLYALESATKGKRLSECHAVSGVSSGAIAGTVFASQLPMEEIVKAMYQQSDYLPPITSSTVYDIAGIDILKRVLKETASWVSLNPQRWIDNTLRTLPTGILKGDNLERYFRDVIKISGGSDRFSDFKTKLFIGATDQDSYEHITLGKPPWDKIPVSEAIRASAALPPVFLPKQINGRWFIDGQVTKTTNLELMIEEGCSLVIIVNPLRPHSMAVPGDTDRLGGIFGVIQTMKALVTSRFESSLRHITERYPDVDFIVFEPDEECAQMMSGSPMKYRIRTKIIQLAYESTLRKLRDRHHVYSVKLGKYGCELASVDEILELEKVDVSQLGNSR